MSTTTYLELCRQTQAATDISGIPIVSVENQSSILADLVVWVADADVAVQREAINWDFLYKDDFSVNTAIGVGNYVKPADFGQWDRRTFFLDYTSDDYTRLSEIGYRAYFNQLGPGTQTATRPSNFILKPGGDIIIHTVPDTVYTLTANYWRTAKRMVANDDVSLIPENYIRVIIARAKMYYAIDQEADRVYREAESEYQNVLSELKSDQLPGWEGYRVSDNVEITISTDGFTGDPTDNNDIIGNFEGFGG